MGIDDSREGIDRAHPAPLKTAHPLGGVRGFRWAEISTKFAPHTALNVIARGKLTFHERVMLQRVELKFGLKRGTPPIRNRPPP